MARVHILLTTALAVASCASSPDVGATADEPGWLNARVAEADATEGGYPPLSEFPKYVPTTNSQSQWREGLADMATMREEVLNDPAMEDPDDPDAPGDAAAFAKRSRAETARDVARQSVDE